MIRFGDGSLALVFSPRYRRLPVFRGVGPVACSEFWSVCHEIRRSSPDWPAPASMTAGVSSSGVSSSDVSSSGARAGPCGISQGRFSMLVRLSVTRRSAPQLAESLGPSSFFLFSNISGISPVGGHFSGFPQPADTASGSDAVATGQRPGSNLWAIAFPSNGLRLRRLMVLAVLLRGPLYRWAGWTEPIGPGAFPT